MAASASYYRVVVERNLVCRICPIDPASARCREDDPLAVSTQLAQNNRNNGCLDGEYDFETFEAARHFAALCADYLKSFCDRSIEAINRLERPSEGAWHNPFIPQPPHETRHD